MWEDKRSKEIDEDYDVTGRQREGELDRPGGIFERSRSIAVQRCGRKGFLFHRFKGETKGTREMQRERERERLKHKKREKK